MSQFTDKCKTSPKYKQFLKHIEKGKYSLNIPEFYKKCEGYHAVRAVRRLTTKGIVSSFQREMVAAILQNQQNRSDVVSLKKDCYKVSCLLDWHIEELKSYLIVKFSNSYQSLGNQNNRDAAFNTLFADAYNISSQLEAFIGFADILIDDFDKASWALTGITKVLETNQLKGAEL